MLFDALMIAGATVLMGIATITGTLAVRLTLHPDRTQENSDD